MEKEEITLNAQPPQESLNAGQGPEEAELSDSSGSEGSARAEIRRMLKEMGAETLLDIIKDNRNAAIRQILKEVEASRPPLQSGTSVAKGCNSIFELAALA